MSREEHTIALPAKTLVVLCGAAGSGKSTFAAQHFTPTQIVSSDFCRTLISDSDSNFRINSGTFDLFHMIIQKRLKLGRRTCADSTALYAFARAPLLEMAKEADFHTCLIIFTVSLDLCLQRNAQRERLVPIHVIEDQCASLQYARREHIHTEAWDQIHELGTDVTGVRFVRKNRSVAMHQ